MVDKILLLPDSLANKIAAGEVVQRPASVVKELLENAVDAEATQISLVIKDGGSSLIQVKDNGMGMSVTDARLCWERHATSKIKKVEDLFNIRSFGFRGEALASIAAVARVEMKTKRDEDAMGTHIMIEDCKVHKQEPIQTNKGTSIAVSNLFYNLPARRNFLKSMSVENRHCTDEFIRVALAYPHIDFTLTNNGTELFRLLPVSLKQRFFELMGYKSNTRLLPVNEETDFITLQGWICEPSQAKKSRGEQFFFVNNRYVKDNYLNHAVFSAYQDLIEKDRFASFVLNISLDPKHVDINVHPTKTEVKFDDERAVYIFVKSVVRKALSGLLAAIEPEDSAISSFLNQRESTFIAQPNPKVDNSFNPFGNQQTYSPKIHPNWERYYDMEKEETNPVQLPLVEKTPVKHIEIEHCFSLSQGIIVAKVMGYMQVIHQHRAHLRILYEKFLNALNNHPVSSQALLFPRTIVLSAADFELFNSLQPDIVKLGVEMHAFGSNKVIVNGLPPTLIKANEKDLLEGLLEQYKLNKNNINLGHTAKLALALASKTAIASNKNLPEEEQKQLVQDLFACPFNTTCPKGERIFFTYSADQWVEKFDTE